MSGPEVLKTGHRGLRGHREDNESGCQTSGASAQFLAVKRRTELNSSVTSEPSVALS